MTSFNCRRELAEAVRLKKPIFLLVETDPNKGATTVEQLKGELAVLLRNGSALKHIEAAKAMIRQLEFASAPDAAAVTGERHLAFAGARRSDSLPHLPDVIEWHREKVFKNRALKVVVANLLELESQRRQTERTSNRAIHEHSLPHPTSLPLPAALLTPSSKDHPPLDRASDRQSIKPSMLRSSDEPPALPGDGRIVHLSAAYREIASVVDPRQSMFDEVEARFLELRVKVIDTPRQGVAEIMLLCHGCFENISLVEMMRRHLPQPKERTNARRSQAGVGPETTCFRQRTNKSIRQTRRLTLGASSRADLNSMQKQLRSMVGSESQEMRTSVIHLYSTRQAFIGYMNQCQESAPELNECGLFSFMFMKWPTSVDLQHVLVQDQLLPMLSFVLGDSTTSESSERSRPRRIRTAFRRTSLISNLVRPRTPLSTRFSDDRNVNAETSAPQSQLSQQTVQSQSKAVSFDQPSTDSKRPGPHDLVDDLFDTTWSTGLAGGREAVAEHMSTEKAAAEKAAAVATKKAPAEKVTAEKITAENAVPVAERATAEKAAAEKTEVEKAAVEKAVAEKVTAEKAAAKKAAAEKADVAVAGAPPLPAGWKQAQTPDGRPYYYVRGASKSQWQRPTVPAPVSKRSSEGQRLSQAGSLSHRRMEDGSLSHRRMEGGSVSHRRMEGGSLSHRGGSLSHRFMEATRRLSSYSTCKTPADTTPSNNSEPSNTSEPSNNSELSVNGTIEAALDVCSLDEQTAMCDLSA